MFTSRDVHTMYSVCMGRLCCLLSDVLKLAVILVDLQGYRYMLVNAHQRSRDLVLSRVSTLYISFICTKSKIFNNRSHESMSRIQEKFPRLKKNYMPEIEWNSAHAVN